MKKVLNLLQETNLPVYVNLNKELDDLKKTLKEITINFNLICIDMYYGDINEEKYYDLKNEINKYKDAIHKKEQEIIKKYEPEDYTDKINNALKYSNYKERDNLINEIIKSYKKSNVI